MLTTIKTLSACAPRPRLAWLAALGCWAVSATPASAAVERPLWELGLGVGAVSFPDYRGSKNQAAYVLPAPYLVYRGKIFKADRSGVRGVLFDSDRVQLNLSLAASLARSSKDLEEHEYAVRSVADALAPHCTGMNVPESPFVLHLPNVMHLATDVTGVLSDSSGALSLVASLHPSAAVGGTPTAAAVELIDRIECLDRGRYAGPVGWIGASGDGEWGIGLRSAQVLADGRGARVFAGCGIVADSAAADELAEADAKLVPVRGALS